MTYLQTRIYRRPTVPLTLQAHWAAGGSIARYARPGWSAAQRSTISVLRIIHCLLRSAPDDPLPLQRLCSS